MMHAPKEQRLLLPAVPFFSAAKGTAGAPPAFAGSFGDELPRGAQADSGPRVATATAAAALSLSTVITRRLESFVSAIYLVTLVDAFVFLPDRDGDASAISRKAVNVAADVNKVIHLG